MTQVSAGYMQLTATQFATAAAELDGAWCDAGIPAQQRALVDGELVRLRAGEDIATFRVLNELVRSVQPAPSSILDIGCASGYYSEVLAHGGWSGHYLGVDRSAPLIELARQRYPQLGFEVRDATDLTDVGQHDLVLSSACLLHIPRWPVALAAAARCSRAYVLVHRTPVTRGGVTIYWQKEAYGVPCVEIHFGRDELLTEIEHSGLRVVEDRHISEHGDYDMRSYLCRVAV